MIKNGFSNKMVEFNIHAKINGVYDLIEDVIKFKVPDVEFADGEITGAGLLGTVNVPDMYNPAAMVFSISTRSYNESYKATLDPKGVEFLVTWVIDKIGTEEDFDVYTAVIKGKAKKIPGLDGEKSNSMELETEYSVMYYKLIRNGQVICEIDVLNTKLVLNDVDYTARLNELMESQ